MRIPTTPPGGTPYYPGPPINGMEMNPQWQGNGVIIDGSAAGNGAPYVHMPHHIHPAGYAPPPGYYGPNSPPAPSAGPPLSQDFSEYMWMENMEEFDEAVMKELEEEALMEQCVEAMLADEEAQNRAALSDQVIESTLNPLAAEFVPKFAIASAPPPAEPEAPTQASTSDDVKSLETAVAEISISNNNESESADSTDGAKASHSGKGGEGKKSPVMENVVVVSAKDTVKTAREQKVEKKKENVKPEQKTNNKDVKKKEESTKSQNNSKPVGKPQQKSSSPTAEVVESKPVVKEEVSPPVDLQGPPLPTPAALATASPAPVVEPEVKPAAPVVFNYAAAARANLPPKQPAAPVTASVPPKDTPRAVPPKTEASVPTKDHNSAMSEKTGNLPRQNRQGAGQKTGHKPSSAGPGKKGKK